MKRKENTLTKAEFQLMSILWDINHSACAWDILEHYEEPKPAYTTIATYLKVPTKRGLWIISRTRAKGRRNGMWRRSHVPNIPA